MIADNTGKINCNFYGEIGEALKPGDIVFLIGAYTNIYNSKMVLYQSAKGGVYRLRDFFYVFDASFKATPNLSDNEWSREVDGRGKEFFKMIKNNTMQ